MITPAGIATNRYTNCHEPRAMPIWLLVMWVSCKIGEISGAIAAAVTEQGAATQEIARSVEIAAKRTHELIPLCHPLPVSQIAVDIDADAAWQVVVDAIARYRGVMGATNPANAADGTIRKLFAKSMGENSAHGSDSAASAEREIALNFRLDEIVG